MYHLERGKLLLQQHRFKEAVAEFRQHLSSFPDDAQAHVYLAICHLNADQITEAEASINEAIRLDPSDSFTFYMYSRIFLAKEKSKDAMVKINEAIAMEPYRDEYFAWRAQLFLLQKDYELALQSADEALAIDPGNVDALNHRATALIKLNKKEEAFATINEALYEDPENSNTHANTAWSILERGDHRKAIHHFSEALRFNPNNEWAKHGMIEALKARYWLYRVFLKYMFWIGNMKPGMQAALIFGLWFGMRYLNNLADKNPSMAIFIYPLLILYSLFAFSTWIIQPLFNMLLFWHPQGKFILSDQERKGALLTSLLFAAGVISLLIYIPSQIETFLIAGIFFVTMMLPCASIFNKAIRKGKITLTIYAGIMALMGVLTIVACAAGLAYETLGTIYLALLFIYQWVFNFIVIRN
ncbi:MAG: tetratricopeptide repeat protein [Bacteroidetes bacterium]|nr:tetratricopeptide repeat protein [Bacteroidota bacterium]